MDVCKKCNSEINGNFCANCGHQVSVKRINGKYILHEIASILNFEKGFFFSIKELLLRPGQSIREFISEDRNRLVKPIMFVIVCSLLYTLLARLFNFEDSYIKFSGEEESAILLIFSWMKSNYGYANILMAIFISFWIKVFFIKYDYNLFEILILLCFILGVMMLLFSMFGIIDGLTNLHVVQYSGIIGFVYCTWAIGQFFDKSLKMNYLKAFLSYFLGMITFVASVLGVGFILDLI